MPLTIDAMALRDFFLENKLCESLTLEEVDLLRQYLNERKFEKGQVLAAIDSVSDELFFVLTGCVELFHMDATGAETEVGKMKKGTLAGEISFFDRRPRTIGMKAGKDGAAVLYLTHRMYSRLKYEHPIIAVNLLENAIVSLDDLIRHMGDDMTILNNYVFSVGRQ